MIRIGAEVKPGDILIGKNYSKKENQILPGREIASCNLSIKAGDVKMLQSISFFTWCCF
jgi:DNA-directed RNA polymerase beta subunit